jgi:hypothetical protein
MAKAVNCRPVRAIFLPKYRGELYDSNLLLLEFVIDGVQILLEE